MLNRKYVRLGQEMNCVLVNLVQFLGHGFHECTIWAPATDVHEVHSYPQSSHIVHPPLGAVYVTGAGT